ncbi:mfs allantoate transporter [Lichtheimia corymbifera JMRC:FSU:9682]|uniref:Mfs allantoate transporter n=2 Tax=Lichtheimia corymbifera JMRC:FSU:9682 TaxID=1263082 RepID=A0A068S4M2_9FUNG|nr:mfs allantoate transporter [Lichtheimia corymbifera JMRC:FSU:9682]
MATDREEHQHQHQQEKIETEHTEHSIKYDPESATSLSDPEKSSNKIQEPFVKSPEEKKLVRKITFTLMPFIAFVCMLQFADKAALSVSAVLGLYQDTGITGSQFSWLGSMFFIGHLVCQPINNILIQKLPVGRYLGACIFIWGLVMLGTALCHTFPQLMAVRFLLGFFEGTAMPCVYLIVNTLFRRSEQTSMYGLVTMASGWGSIFGGLVAYGISNMGHQRGIMMWRWNHIIFGCMTVLLGILCFFFLVDNPKSWLLRLTEQEKAITEERTQDNAVVRHQKIKWDQMWEACKEIRLWCVCLAGLGLNLQNGALQVFSAQFIKELGDFTPGESILLKVPAGTASFLGVVFATLVARRTRQICYTGAFMSTVSLAGCIILAVVESGPAKLAGFYISWALTGGYSLLITTIASNVSGYSKKVFYNGAFVTFYGFGNFIGPIVMLDYQAPRYVGAMIGFCIGNGVAIVCYLIMRFWMARENRDRLINPPAEAVDVHLDLTDRQNRNFIYRL